jgi:hypothetical protein
MPGCQAHVHSATMQARTLCCAHLWHRLVPVPVLCCAVPVPVPVLCAPLAPARACACAVLCCACVCACAHLWHRLVPVELAALASVALRQLVHKLGGAWGLVAQ